MSPAYPELTGWGVQGARWARQFLLGVTTLTLVNTQLLDAIVGSPYPPAPQSFQVLGGQAPYTFTIDPTAKVAEGVVLVPATLPLGISVDLKTKDAETILANRAPGSRMNDSWFKYTFPDFTISMRSHWNGKDLGELRGRVAAFAAVGVQHVMVHPLNRDIDDWDEVIEGVGRLAAG